MDKGEGDSKRRSSGLAGSESWMEVDDNDDGIDDDGRRESELGPQSQAKEIGRKSFQSLIV